MSEIWTQSCLKSYQRKGADVTKKRGIRGSGYFKGKKWSNFCSVMKWYQCIKGEIFI